MLLVLVVLLLEELVELVVVVLVLNLLGFLCRCGGIARKGGGLSSFCRSCAPGLSGADR